LTKPLKKDNPTGINSNYKFSAVKHLDILKILMHLGHESETWRNQKHKNSKPSVVLLTSFSHGSGCERPLLYLLFVLFNVRTPAVDASLQGEPNKKNHMEILTSTRDNFLRISGQCLQPKGRISPKKTKKPWKNANWIYSYWLNQPS